MRCVLPFGPGGLTPTNRCPRATAPRSVSGGCGGRPGGAAPQQAIASKNEIGVISASSSGTLPDHGLLGPADSEDDLHDDPAFNNGHRQSIPSNGPVLNSERIVVD